MKTLKFPAIIFVFVVLSLIGCTNHPVITSKEVPGATIRLVERGPKNKTPIIIVHGGPGSPGKMWFLTNFLKNFHTIEYFQRDIENSPSKGPFTVAAHVEDLHQLVSRYYPNAIIVGHSWGATLALEYGKKYASEVKKIIVISPGTMTNKMDKAFTENIFKSAGDKEPLAKRLWAELKTAKGKSGYDAKWKEYRDLIKNAYCHDCESFNRNRKKLDQDKYHLSGLEKNAAARDQVWKDYWNMVKRGEIVKNLNHIQTKLVHFEPEFDINPPDQLITILSSQVKNYKLYKISGSGHVPWLETDARKQLIPLLKKELTNP